MRARALVGVLAALLALPAAASAAPADLDTSYGGGTGKAFLDAGKDEFAGSMLLQPDGRALLLGGSGASDAVGSKVAVARFTTAGAPDLSMGGSGFSQFFDLGKQQGLGALALRPDGRIVTAGVITSGTRDLLVVQLLQNGARDASFGPAGQNGAVTIDLSGGADSASAVVVRPDGKLTIGGTRGSDFVAAQLTNPQASLDPAFNGGIGFRVVDMGSANDAVAAAAPGPAGSTLLAGVWGTTNTDFAITRLTSGGSPDGAFAPPQAQRYVDFGGGRNDTPAAMAVQPDGKVLVAGRSFAGPSSDFAIVRLTQAGAVDTTFGNEGKVLVDFGASDWGEAVALQPNGKIVVAGRTGDDWGVARLQPGGQPDSTFGNAGKLVLNMGGNDGVAGVAVQRDGKIVVGGMGKRTNLDFAVARLLGDFVPGAGGGGVGGKASRCAGRRATIIGTNRKDRLRGTRKADVIVALGGNDSVDGKGGNDIVCGGSGKDNLKGAGGKDKVYGQSGKDRESGGAGNDLLDGGAAADRLSGGSGKDRLKGGAGNDRLAGGAAKDRLLGGPGKDRLAGGGGKDVLRGGPGRDKQKQ